MTFKRMPDGRIEISDGFRICVLVKAKHILALIKDVNQTAHAGKDVCRVAFHPNTHLASLVGSEEPDEYDGKKRTAFMYVYMDLHSARIELRKAMGMTDAEVSEDLGMELLGEVA